MNIKHKILIPFLALSIPIIPQAHGQTSVEYKDTLFNISLNTKLSHIIDDKIYLLNKLTKINESMKINQSKFPDYTSDNPLYL